jgi:hypothetical protein
VWSKYKVTADKGISGDSRWWCVNLSHDGQVARVVEISTEVARVLEFSTAVARVVEFNTAVARVVEFNTAVARVVEFSTAVCFYCTVCMCLSIA